MILAIGIRKSRSVMSLSHAFRFYNLFKQDSDFRKACYACKSREAWQLFLKNEGFEFSDNEFEEVLSASLFRCQTEEEALQVRQIQQAYKVLTMFTIQ